MKGYISFVLVLAASVIFLSALHGAINSENISLERPLALESSYQQHMNAKEVLQESIRQGSLRSWCEYIKEKKITGIKKAGIIALIAEIKEAKDRLAEGAHEGFETAAEALKKNNIAVSCAYISNTEFERLLSVDLAVSTAPCNDFLSVYPSADGIAINVRGDRSGILATGVIILSSENTGNEKNIRRRSYLPVSKPILISSDELISKTEACQAGVWP